jgi:hypothetical protein
MSKSMKHEEKEREEESTIETYENKNEIWD